MMSDDKYPRSEGGLWLNDRKTAENHPSVTGHIQISPEQLKVLVTLHRGGVAPEKINLDNAPEKIQPVQLDEEFDDDIPFRQSHSS